MGFDEEDAFDDDDLLADDFEEPEISDGGTTWGEAALKIAQDVLQQPNMQGLELYSFSAISESRVLRVSIDKLEDEFGSPSIEDITNFSRAMNVGLEEALGEDVAGDLEIEVSSPGAERVLRLPGELARFQQLPMQVEYQQPDSNVDTRVLRLLEYDDAAQSTKWGLADVAVNKKGKKKGQGLNRKERDMVFEIPVPSIRRVRLHLDM